jgi:ssDNA-binding Zn-finger/Zn-ribbon topoisomerase 1
MQKRCGGCGSDVAGTLRPVKDKKQNSGFLCAACEEEYGGLLGPDSIRNFWMCGACAFRVLAGTRIDAKVDELNGKCPSCGADVNATLVNLKGDRRIASGIIGEPLE